MWPSASVRPLYGFHLLLADDAASIRQLYGDALRLAGAEVVEAEDGAAALAKWVESNAIGHSYDVVVLDFSMPQLDGVEVAGRLRSGGFAGAIVGISGEIDADGEDRWLAAGCDRVICKGHSLPDFVSAVAAACGRWNG